MVKTGKLALLLAHLQYIRQILKPMVKIRTLRPLRIYKSNTFPRLQHTSESGFASVKYAINTPDLIQIPERDLGAEDLMRIGLLPELRLSGGYENIITEVDVFSIYAFAYPISNPTAVNTAEVNIDIVTRHAYLSTLIITHQRSVFISQVIHKLAEMLGINLKHVTSKYAQTIGVLERAHVTIKTSFKMVSGEYGNNGTSIYPLRY